MEDDDDLDSSTKKPYRSILGPPEPMVALVDISSSSSSSSTGSFFDETDDDEGSFFFLLELLLTLDVKSRFISGFLDSVSSAPLDGIFARVGVMLKTCDDMVGYLN
jgi:flagellar biosynthesis protein FliR